MGKLGGAELSYASDLDVLFVHDGPAEGAERLAETLIRDIGSQTTEGRAWEIDARLRPEGRAGALALTIDGYRSYWADRARLWERQALRAGPAGGRGRRAGRPASSGPAPTWSSAGPSTRTRPARSAA